MMSQVYRYPRLVDLPAAVKMDDDDLLLVVDVGDQTDDATGSSKQITARNARRRTASIVVDASARDAGASPTTSLRALLCMARITASGKYVPYDPDESAGAEVPVGFLRASTDVSGGDAAADLYLGGEFARGDCLGIDLLGQEILARRGFGFRESASPDVLDVAAGCGFLGVSRFGSNHTITAAEHGRLLIATAAVAFTLPTKANGLRFDLLQIANADMTVQDGASTIVARNNAAAASVAYSTASQKIGARCRVECVYIDVATLAWVFTNFCNHTITVT